LKNSATFLVRVMGKQEKLGTFAGGKAEETIEGEKVQGPYDLPEGWKWVKLKDLLIGKPQYGLTSKSEKEGKILYVRITDIDNSGKLIQSNLQYVDIDDETFKKYEIQEEDILIARSGATAGKVFLCEKSMNAVFASYLIRFRIKREKVCPKYLFYFFHSNEYWNQVRSWKVGGAQPNINAQNLQRLNIPLPPLEEQKRIVSRLEQLVNRAEEAKRLRKQAREEAEKIMQAALNKVFSRAEEEGWSKVEIKDVVREFQSGFPCSKIHAVESGVPHLRPNNIGFYGKLDLSQLVFIPSEIVDLNKYSLRKGDILFNNTNSKELVGRACLVKEDLDCAFSNHITRLRVNMQLITPEWLTWNINYLWLKGHFLTICRKWIGQAGVNTTMLESTKIFLPPLEEQKKMIAYLAKISEIIESLKKLQQRTEGELEKLVPAILDKAFKGEL